MKFPVGAGVLVLGSVLDSEAVQRYVFVPG